MSRSNEESVSVTVPLEELPVSVDMWHKADHINISMSSTMDLNRHLRAAAVKLRTTAIHQAKGKGHILHSPKSCISTDQGKLCLILSAQMTTYT